MARTVAVDVAAAARRDGAIVLDVREPHEYVTGHVPGARMLPVDQVSRRVQELPRAEPVYVICQSGNRSASVCELLERHGFDARSVMGGTSAWVGAGHPVVPGPRG
ncbi:rhodanese-like domain-containing protein [Isoptericola sp. b490]|uniref:rhodanese-like domain-containing protein n=1 Tax=Actinotalea lenta TaxID=3064654 RepID=UPI00271367DB|nr:rhodanese-like domain-containing protein [Isoptericola sp. b490]MDO8120456.1 rhodanese-like domain-containing protein [Isoptericola sp. b490]